VRAPRQDWMTGIEWLRAGLESLMFGIAFVYLVMLLIVIFTFVGGQP
jgi:hypothetical protein